MARIRRLHGLLLIAAALVLCLIGFNLGVEAVVSASESPDMMAGAEARTLGPEDASKAVIFVHGFVGAGNNFNDVPDQLAEKGWRVQVLCLPGHGTTPRDLRTVSVENLRVAVRNAVNEEREQREFVALVGHSMGGALSTLVASEGNVDALVLAAPFFGVTHKWWYGLHPETWSRLVNPVVRWTYKGKLFLQVNKPEAKDQIVSYNWIPSEAIATLHKIGEDVNDREMLAEVTCPVLWIHSPGDVAASYEMAQKGVESMASERKKVLALKRSNHHIFWDYEAEEVAEDVIHFLQDVEEEAEAQPELPEPPSETVPGP
jgi:carboxylesterase